MSGGRVVWNGGRRGGKEAGCHPKRPPKLNKRDKHVTVAPTSQGVGRLHGFACNSPSLWLLLSAVSRPWSRLQSIYADIPSLLSLICLIATFATPTTRSVLLTSVSLVKETILTTWKTSDGSCRQEGE